MQLTISQLFCVHYFLADRGIHGFSVCRRRRRLWHSCTLLKRLNGSSWFLVWWLPSTMATLY